MIASISQKLIVTYVVGGAQHDFGSSEPLGYDVDVTGNSGGSSSTSTSSRAEVTDLEFAVSIDQKIARLEISEQDVSRVDVFESTQSLVYERLKVGISQGLSRTNLRDKSGTICGRSGIFLTIACRSASIRSS